MEFRSCRHRASAEEAFVEILSRPPPGMPHRGAEEVVDEWDSHDIVFAGGCDSSKALAQGSRDHLVGVKDENPIASSLSQRESTGGVRIPHSLMKIDACPVLLGYLPGPIVAMHVDHDDFIRPLSD